MPAPTVEQLEKTEASLKKVIAEQGETTEAVKHRATKKKLRRAQRKRRRFVVTAAAIAKKQPKPAPAAESSEDPKAE